MIRSRHFRSDHHRFVLDRVTIGHAAPMSARSNPSRKSRDKTDRGVPITVDRLRCRRSINAVASGSGAAPIRSFSATVTMGSFGKGQLKDSFVAPCCSKCWFASTRKRRRRPDSCWEALRVGQVVHALRTVPVVEDCSRVVADRKCFHCLSEATWVTVLIFVTATEIVDGLFSPFLQYLLLGTTPSVASDPCRAIQRLFLLVAWPTWRWWLPPIMPYWFGAMYCISMRQME
jgi:hypothetical protein